MPDETNHGRTIVLIRMWRRSALASSLALALIAGACARKGPDQSSAPPPDTLPPPALTDRAQRDSARVAQILLAYYEFVAKRDTAAVRRLFYPESILVGTPDGGVEVEGQGSALLQHVANLPHGASPIGRIVLLRRKSQELLEQTYRETWIARFTLGARDTAVIETRFHVIEPLGRDTRWLGSIPGRD